jgi:hypothetical protein
MKTPEPKPESDTFRHWEHLTAQLAIEQRAFWEKKNAERAAEVRQQAEINRRNTKVRLIQNRHTEFDHIEGQDAADLLAYADPKMYRVIDRGCLQLRKEFALLQRPPQTAGYDAMRGGENFPKPFGFHS